MRHNSAEFFHRLRQTAAELASESAQNLNCYVDLASLRIEWRGEGRGTVVFDTCWQDLTSRGHLYIDWHAKENWVVVVADGGGRVSRFSIEDVRRVDQSTWAARAEHNQQEVFCRAVAANWPATEAKLRALGRCGA